MKKDKLGDKTRIEHIAEAIGLLEEWTQGVGFDDFADNVMLLHACLRQFEIIGEASNHLSEELRGNYPQVVWGKIIALRNLLIHEYFGVSAPFIWQVIYNDLPVFKSQIEKIYQEL